MIKKEKKHIRKEYVQIGVAIFILILLSAALIYLIFFDKKDYEVKIPDLPTTTEIEVGVVDFADEASDKMDLTSKKTKKVDISYTVISDFYKKGIVLSNPKTYYENGLVYLTSNSSSDIPFVSCFDLEGNLKFLSLLDKEDYDKVGVYQLVFDADSFYVFCVGTKNDKQTTFVNKYTLNGAKVYTKVIYEDFEKAVADVYKTTDGFIMVSTSTKDIFVSFLNDDFSAKSKFSSEETFDLDEYSYPIYKKSVYIDGKVEAVIQISTVLYKLEINPTTREAILSKFEISNDEEKLKYMQPEAYLDGYIFLSEASLYKTDVDGKLINKMDYSKVKVEEVTDEIKKKYRTDDYTDEENTDMEVENFISVSKASVNDDKIIVTGNTLISYFYDIYDSKLNIEKRYVIPSDKYEVEDGSLLKTIYKDDSIYELYLFGDTTPSILISKIK